LIFRESKVPSLALLSSVWSPGKLSFPWPVSLPLLLAGFRQRPDGGQSCDPLDVGGCACFFEPEGG